LGADSALVPDQAASQALRRALEDPEEASVLHALDMIADLPLADWANAFQTLTRHPSAQVRSRALRLLGTTGSLDRAPAIHACLRDPEPLVRAAAIDSYCAVGRERAISTVAHFLQNPDPDVKSAAIVGLIRHGGLDGVLSAAEHLKALLRSDQTSERTAGARVLGEIQVRNFYNPLLKLLVDADLGVRQAAIRAAGRMGSPELLPALIYRLECPATRRDAMEALVAYGSSAVRVLQRVLSNPDEALGLRLLCPILLARIGDQASLDALLKELLEPTPDLRSRILEAIHRLRLRRPHLKFDRERLSEATLLECRRLYEQTLLARDLASHPGSLLAEALGRRREASLLRLFRLLAGIYPVRAVDAVLVNLGSESRKNRSNALEVLDNLLTKEIKRLVLPLCDPALADLQRDVTAELGLQSAPRADRLKALLMGADRWLAVCAVYEIGIQTERGLAEEVAASIGAADPLLRETALDALAKLLPLDEVRNAAEHHLSDPSREVRALAVRLCAAGPNA